MGDESTKTSPAGLLRRLAALFYDFLLSVALAFAVSFAMLPLTRGQAFLPSAQGLVGHVYHAVWPLAVFAYFGWCWTRSGQTLGLKAWRMRLETGAGGRLGWSAAAGRYLLGVALFWLACVGAWYLWHTDHVIAAMGAAALVAPVVLNFAWIIFDREGRSLMDLATGTRVVVTRQAGPAERYQGRNSSST